MRWTSWMPAACRASGRSAPACSRDFATAAQQGQRIYTLTKANQTQLNELAISAVAKQDIAAALNANREVTVHQHSITHAGWTGEGYIVIDPETGAETETETGAYMISGGLNGSKIVGLLDKVFSAFSGLTSVLSDAFSYLVSVLGSLPEQIADRLGKVFSLLSRALGQLELLRSIHKVFSECDQGAFTMWIWMLAIITTGFSAVITIFLSAFGLIGAIPVIALLIFTAAELTSNLVRRRCNVR